MILCALGKAIARHSLTGLNIIIFHNGLIFHAAIIINRKNWSITIKLNFENLTIFLKKSERTHMLWPPSPCLLLFAFQCPLPSSRNVLFEWPHKRRYSFKVTKYWLINWRIFRRNKINCSPYNPKKNLIANQLNCISRNLDLQLGQNENLILIDDFNVEPNDATMKNFCQICGCKNIAKDKICFEIPETQLALT